MQFKNLSPTQEAGLRAGMLLPLMEEFYTLQGEGRHTGQAAYFLRVGGCDVCCDFCDIKESWNAAIHPLVQVDEVVFRAAQQPAKAVVVTGGEPLLYNMDYLCKQLHAHNITTYLETSGSSSFSGEWNWVCLSAKRRLPPVDTSYAHANELKMVISCKEDLCFAEQEAKKVNKDCLLYLQPEWSVHENLTPIVIDYILTHPQWRISLQSHKFMHIP